MAGYVLVHGGFIEGWYWGEVATRLEKQDHHVTVAELPSTGTDPAALGDLAADAAEVRRLLDAADDGVVLVGHSYGGMVITEVADHPAIRHTVYLAAFWPQRGQSILDLGEQGLGPTPGWIVPRDDGALQITDDPAVAREALCADLDPQRAGKLHRRLVLSAQAGAGMPSTAPERRHPTTYVVCTLDGAIPPAAQQAMAAGADHVARLASAHTPMLSMPDELAAVLDAVS